MREESPASNNENGNGSEENYAVFRDCVSVAVIEKLRVVPAEEEKKSKKSRRRRAAAAGKGTRQDEVSVPQHAMGEGGENDAEELSEFIEYIAAEIFLQLPVELRTLSYAALQNNPSLGTTYATPLETSQLSVLMAPLPPSLTETLTTYGLLSPTAEVVDHSTTSIALPTFLGPVLNAYITTTSAAPPAHTPGVRAESCEICAREHLPLTYHHLIPRAVQAKAVRRGWHAAWEVQKVAWLCRACHSFVHRVASNEELAREWYGVELLMQREDVRAWAAWVGRVRWKAR